MEFIFIQEDSKPKNIKDNGLAIGCISLIVILVVVAIISRWDDKD